MQPPFCMLLVFLAPTVMVTGDVGDFQETPNRTTRLCISQMHNPIMCRFLFCFFRWNVLLKTGPNGRKGHREHFLRRTSAVLCVLPLTRFSF